MFSLPAGGYTSFLLTPTYAATANKRGTVEFGQAGGQPDQRPATACHTSRHVHHGAGEVNLSGSSRSLCSWSAHLTNGFHNRLRTLCRNVMAYVKQNLLFPARREPRQTRLQGSHPVAVLWPPAVVFVERGSAQPWSIGSGQNAKRIIPTGIFRSSDIEQMRMGVVEHLGIAQAPAWLFAAELREGTVLRVLTPYERTVPIVAVRPASRRISAKVRVFIDHLESTFALCSQFNPRAPG